MPLNKDQKLTVGVGIAVVFCVFLIVLALRPRMPDDSATAGLATGTPENDLTPAQVSPSVTGVATTSADYVAYSTATPTPNKGTPASNSSNDSNADGSAH